MPIGVYIRKPNIRYGSTGKHWTMSEDAKQKISDSVKNQWMNGGRKGHNCSEETKEKMSKIAKERGFGKWIKGIHIGKKLPEEQKRKISETRLKRKERLGYLNSPETRKKISEALKGKPHPKRGGYKHTIEARRKMSEDRKGEKSYLWQGGITPINAEIRNGIEFRLWREAVFARDNWTCQKCEVRGIKLHPHHILNFAQYPELRFAIDNGITLCGDCHREFHRIYGVKNNTKEQLEEFLTNN